MSDEMRTPPPTGDNMAAPQGAQLGGARQISLIFNGSSGQSVEFKLKSTTKLGKAMGHYSARVQQPTDQLRFLFDGARLNVDDKPDSLSMEDHDIIDVHMEQIGGAGDVATPTSKVEHLQDWVDMSKDVKTTQNAKAAVDVKTFQDVTAGKTTEELLDDASALIRSHIARLEAVEAACTKLSRDHDELTRDALDAFESGQPYRQQVNQMAGQLTAFEMVNRSLSDSIQELVADNEELVSDNDALHDSVEELKNDVDHLKTSWLTEKSHHEEVSKMNARLEGANQELKNSVTGYRLDVSKLTEAVIDLKAEKIALKADIIKLTDQKQGIKADNDFLNHMNEGRLKENAQLIKAADSLKATEADLKLKNQKLSMKNMALKADNEHLSTINAGFFTQAADLVASADQLKANNDQLAKDNQNLKVHNQELLVEVTMRLAKIQVLAKNTTGLKATIKSLSKEKLALRQMVGKIGASKDATKPEVISICIEGTLLGRRQFCIVATNPLQQVFKSYANHLGVDFERIVFMSADKETFYHPEQTAKQVGVKDDDTLFAIYDPAI